MVELLDRLLGTPQCALRTQAGAADLVGRLVSRVEVSPDSIAVTLSTGATITAAIDGHIAQRATKHWRLNSPEGEKFEFINLSFWLRINGHRFAAADLLPSPERRGSSKALLGLGRLRPGAVRPLQLWKGWTWWNDKRSDDNTVFLPARHDSTRDEQSDG